MRDEPADVVVVGAGAGGAVAALRLVEAGLRVVVLEQGEWPDRATYPGATATWELAAGKQWSAVPAVRNGHADDPIDLTESDMGIVNFNGVGGGTVLYQAAWLRMLPSDFRTHSLEGVGDDWPITYDDLAPFYARVEQQFGVSGLGGDPAYPYTSDPPLPPLPIGEAGRLVARAHARLGWHWWPHPLAIASKPYRGRHGCVQRGTCASGCNEGAKGSTDLTHWPGFVAAGGELVTGACVRRILMDGPNRAAGVEWVDSAGRLRRQHADIVLCAANGIGTPRLLLLSGESSGGIANRSGLVGGRLMLHPTIRAVGLFRDSLGTWQGANGAMLVSFQFYESDARRGFTGHAKWTLGPTGGPLGMVVAGDRWGAEHHGHLRERLGRSAGWNVMCEDAPEASNRVVLSARITDRAGLPAAQLRYRISENVQRMRSWHASQAARSLREAGAWKVEITPGHLNGHFMGTARMGDDPATSVVDRWGFSHDIPNLGIVDGSVFVTSSGVNPTATIAALALRSAEHLVDTWHHRRRNPTRRSAGGVPHDAETLASHRAGPGAAGEPPSPADQTSEPTPILSEAHRSTLSFLADHLIPAHDGMPSASQVGVAGALLDQVLAVRPDLAPALERVLSTPPAIEDRWLPALRQRDPEGAAALTVAVAGAYYLDAGVRARLGYPGQEARPMHALDHPSYIEEGLLDHLLT